MDKHYKIFCIIPAYNEEETIAQVIKEVKQLVTKVVVVDDGSTDNTFNLAQASGATVIKHLINRGQGAALETGNQYALSRKADVVVHFDADGQFLADDIKPMIEPIINDQAEVVFGSRFLEKKSKIPWLKNNIIIPLAHLTNRIFIGETLTDPQSGFRTMSSKAVVIINIEQAGMAHCSEIIAKTLKSKLRIAEVPVTVIYHNFGQRFSGGIKIIRDLLISRLIN